MDSPNYRISLQGVNSTITALERFAPDLKKALDKDIKGVLSKVVNEARSFIPFDIRPSGWARENKNAGLIGPLQQGQGRGSFVRFDAAKAKSGIKSVSPRSSKTSSGFKNAYGVIQRDPAGAIFETAGRGSRASRARTRASRSTNPNASRDFIQAVEKFYGVLPTAKGLGQDKGRALIKAVDDNKKNAQRAIFEAIKDAANKAQSRMDSNLNSREAD
jgi:hypothetical protein